MSESRARAVLTARRNTLTFGTCVIGISFAVLWALASLLPNPGARAVANGAIVLTGLAIAIALSKEIVDLNRDLRTSPMVEDGKLISALRMPKSPYETWYISTPTGRLYVINLTSLEGSTLRGQRLTLTYTPHSRLLVHANLVESE